MSKLVTAETARSFLPGHNFKLTKDNEVEPAIFDLINHNIMAWSRTGVREKDLKLLLPSYAHSVYEDLLDDHILGEVNAINKLLDAIDSAGYDTHVDCLMKTITVRW